MFIIQLPRDCPTEIATNALSLCKGIKLMGFGKSAAA
jgi:hypothetical protein